MKRRTMTMLGLAALVGAFVPLSASGQDDGRPDGSSPGSVPAESAGSDADDSTGPDGDGGVSEAAPGGEVEEVLHAGNVTIDGSACIGNDCNTDPPSPGYGFDTLRLMENNLRILAMDTSGGAFPTRDWQIEFNSSSNGGDNYFKVRDCNNTAATSSTCGGTSQFTIEGGADNDSIYVDSSGNQGGNVGLGTTTPAVDLNILSGNTPTTRLQQDASSGFGLQTWDVAGNEANFFIRDVTNGSSLPIRIEPGVASNTLYLDSTERIGMGTSSPDEELHIRSADAPVIQLEDSSSGVEWQFGDAGNGTFKMSEIGTAGTQFRLSSEGLFRVLAVASPPTTSIGLGAMYNDTSGALCWYDGATWQKVIGAGTCA